MGDSRKVKHAVGGAAESHIYGQGVHEGLAGHNISRADVFLGRSSITCMPACFARLDSLGVNSRNRAVALKAHAENLGQTVHAVGGVHTGTGTAGRTYLALELLHIFLMSCYLLHRRLLPRTCWKGFSSVPPHGRPASGRR